MNKKLCIGLAPLLVTAAFAVMPATTQAACIAPNCPHVYQNGAQTPEAVHLNYIAWGVLTLANSGPLGEAECRTIWGGYLENPPGGGAAVGKIGSTEGYECTSARCESTLGELSITLEKLPWKTEITEPSAGVFRMRIGRTSKAEPEAMFVKWSCTTIAAETFFSETSPRNLNNGVTIGSIPDELQFDQPGSGALESAVLGTVKITGKLKIEGFGGQELISTKNP
jgi:hypothetical protein